MRGRPRSLFIAAAVAGALAGAASTLAGRADATGERARAPLAEQSARDFEATARKPRAAQHAQGTKRSTEETPPASAATVLAPSPLGKAAGPTALRRSQVVDLSAIWPAREADRDVIIVKVRTSAGIVRESFPTGPKGA